VRRYSLCRRAYWRMQCLVEDPDRISALQFSDSFTANVPYNVRFFSWFTGRKISLIVAVNHSWTLYEFPSMIAFYNSLDQLSSTSTELVDRRIFSLFKE